MLDFVTLALLAASAAGAGPGRCTTLTSSGTVTLVRGTSKATEVRLPKCILEVMGNQTARAAATEIVVDGVAEAVQFSPAAVSGVRRQRCIGDSLVATIQNSGVIDAPGVGVCVSHALVTAGVLDDCHAVAHAIGGTVWGRAAEVVHLDRPGAGWVRSTLLNATFTALDICPDQCIFGCVHAVLVHTVETALQLYPASDPGSDAAMQNLFVQVCDHFAPRLNGRYTCSHGIGHGFAAQAQAVPDDGDPYAVPIGLNIERVPDIATAMDFCRLAPMESVCRSGAMMEFVDYTLDAGVAAHAAAHPGAVPTLAMVCPETMFEEEDLARCSGAVGEGLMFSLCHDVELGLELCNHDTRENLREICAADAAGEEGTALGLMQEAEISDCLRRVSGLMARPEELTLARLFRVAGCSDGPDGIAGCCGDGDCAWAETDANCPADCGTEPATPTEAPPLQTVGPDDRCQLQQLNLDFCGPFINFPIFGSLPDARSEDRDLARKFEPVEEYIRTVYGDRNSPDGDLDSAAADGCVAAIQREWCLTAFLMCEGDHNLEYCWHSHPTGQYQNGCPSGSFSCPPNDEAPEGQAVVCGLSPWQDLLLCVREGGGPEWHDLFPGDVTGAVERGWGQPACAALAELPEVHSPCEQTSCTGHGKEAERCYDRRITSDGDGDGGLVETFFAAGENRPDQTLWVTRPAGDTPPPSPPATLAPDRTMPPPVNTPTSGEHWGSVDQQDDAPAQCLDLADPSSAYGLLGQLSTADECGAIVQLLTAQAMPLLATPEAIPAVLYGLLDTHTADFCRCLVGLPSGVVESFFPTAGCKLGEYAAGDLLSLCAAAGVDTTAQLCNRGCQPHGSSGSRFGSVELGDPAHNICCVCSASGAAAGCGGGGGGGSSPSPAVRAENGTATDTTDRTGKVVGAMVVMAGVVATMAYFAVCRRRGGAPLSQFGAAENVELLDVLWDSGESDSEEVYARHTVQPVAAAALYPEELPHEEVDLMDEL